MNILLPSRKGTKTEREAQYFAFADALRAIDRGLDFRMGPRDWCYHLEEHGLSKDQFDAAERVINRCRDTGLLPIDFVLDDESRKPVGADPSYSDGDVAGYLDGIWDSVDLYTRHYDAVPWVGYQPYYVEVLVEKAGLKSLFEVVGSEFMTMVSNGRGDTDYLSRARMLTRFKAAQDRGQQVVLLYCGDFDPKGLMISDGLRNNLAKLVGARFRDGTEVECDVDEIVIERFGLNYDYILRELPQTVWTDNLITSSGKSLADPNHPDYRKYRIEEYIERYGVRKCEANAIVVRPEAGRQLLRDALAPYVDLDGVARYRADIAAGRTELAAELPGYLHQRLESAA